MNSVLFISGDVSTISVDFDLDIRPLPEVTLPDNIAINVTAGTKIGALSTAVAEKATVNLPDAEYEYSYNAANNSVDVKLGGELIVALPVNNQGQSSSVSIGANSAGSIQVNGDGTIGTGTEPTEDGITNVIQASDAVDGLLTATAGQDVFVLNVNADQNGAFTEFGELTIQGYEKGQDIIAFIDQLNEWGSVADFQNGSIGQDQGVSATIGFNNDPTVTSADQSLTIMGAQKANIFSNEISTLDVDFAVAGQQTVTNMGLQAYADSLIA